MAAAGTGATLALLGGAAPAFAGWTPAPTTAAPGQLQQALSDCQQQMPVDGLPLVLSDTRGPFTFEIFANDRSSVDCINGPSFTGGSALSAAGPIETPADELGLMEEHATSRDGNAFTFVLGRAGANVTGATLDLADGTHVDATVQNGWFVAWWPGLIEAPTATLSTTDGSKTQTFPTQKCSLAQCAGGTSTSSSTTSTGPSTTGTPGPGATVVGFSSGGGKGQAGAYSFNSQSVK